MRLDHVNITIPPGAEPEARAFYCDLLGMTEIPRAEGGRTDGFWCQLEGGQFHVSVEEGVDRAATRAHAALALSDGADLDSLRAALEARGIECADPHPVPGQRRFHCRDPWGNRLELLQHDA